MVALIACDLKFNHLLKDSAGAGLLGGHNAGTETHLGRVQVFSWEINAM